MYIYKYSDELDTYMHDLYETLNFISDIKLSYDQWSASCSPHTIYVLHLIH
jgi:hypothetical protein